jgi:hypothetical protein
MFDSIESPDEEKEPTDYSALKIVAILVPVFVIFVCLGRAEMGFTVIIVLGMTMAAIKLRWKLRKHVWFWAAIAFILLLHIPLFFFARWPDTKTPTIAYSMPVGIVDFLLIMGAISLAKKNLFERFFVRR